MKYKELGENELQEQIEILNMKQGDLATLIDLKTTNGWKEIEKFLNLKINKNLKAINDINVLEFEESKESIKYYIMENKALKWVLTIPDQAIMQSAENNVSIGNFRNALLKIKKNIVNAVASYTR